MQILKEQELERELLKRLGEAKLAAKVMDKILTKHDEDVFETGYWCGVGATIELVLREVREYHEKGFEEWMSQSKSE